MEIPNYRQLMQPVLVVLEKAGGELDFAELVVRLLSYLDLGEMAERKQLTSGSETVFFSNVRWAVSYLATDGRVKFSGDDDNVQLINDVVELGHGFSDAATPFEMCAPEDMDEALGKLFTRASRRLKQTLMGRIYAREPAFFEQLILDLLLAMGYGGSRVDLTRRIGGSMDGGVDGVVYQDELGLDFFYVQAKRYKPSSTVPISEIRDFAGSLEAHKAPKGVFVTTSFFPRSAQKFIDAVPRRITLIDGGQLADLMIRHNIGVMAEPVYQLKGVNAKYFSV